MAYDQLGQPEGFNSPQADIDDYAYQNGGDPYSKYQRNAFLVNADEGLEDFDNLPDLDLGEGLQSNPVSVDFQGDVDELLDSNRVARVADMAGVIGDNTAQPGSLDLPGSNPVNNLVGNPATAAGQPVSPMPTSIPDPAAIQQQPPRAASRHRGTFEFPVVPRLPKAQGRRTAYDAWDDDDYQDYEGNHPSLADDPRWQTHPEAGEVEPTPQAIDAWNKQNPDLFKYDQSLRQGAYDWRDDINGPTALDASGYDLPDPTKPVLNADPVWDRPTNTGTVPGTFPGGYKDPLQGIDPTLPKGTTAPRGRQYSLPKVPRLPKG
jgi:hypothetical protein